MNKKINRASELVDIQDSYFVRMMLPHAEAIAHPFLKEEKRALKNLLSNTDESLIPNIAVIGAGSLWYLEIADKFSRQYIGVEPRADIFIPKQLKFLISKHKNIQIISHKFGDFSRDKMKKRNTIYAFIFNLLAYIEHPIKKINSYIEEGDILFISSWNQTSLAKKTRKIYFDYLNALESIDSKIIDPEDTTGLCDLEMFPFHKLKYYKKHERIIGKVADVLVIYC